MYGQRKLLIFLARIILVLVILTPLWVLVAPYYSIALAATTDAVTPSSTAYAAEDNYIRITSQQEAFSVVLTIHGLSLQYGLLVLMALIIATPGLGIRKRLMSITVAPIIMFALHIIAMVIMGSVAKSVTPANPTVAGNPLHILFISIGFDLFPILVWTALSYKYWFPRPANQQTVPQANNSLKTSMQHGKEEL